MGWNTRVDDWEVTGLVEVGGGEGIAAGVWMFEFQSYNAGAEGHIVLFVGLGIGFGGSIGGSLVPDIGAIIDRATKKPIPRRVLQWSSIDCRSKFSINDLNYCPGRLSNGSAAVSVGYDITYISALKKSRDLFFSQSCGGLSIGGLGLDIMSVGGFWKWLGPAAYDWG
jgi:hypothetical protein